MLNIATRISLRSITVAVCFSTLSSGAIAGIKLVYSIDALERRADAIVVARPIMTDTRRNLFSSRFVIEEVLRGGAELKSREIRIDLTHYSRRRDYSYLIRSAGKPKLVRSALLFLHHSRKPNTFDYEPGASGIRMLRCIDGTLLKPQQYQNPGPYGFVIDDKTDWNRLLADLRNAMPLKNAMHAFLSGKTAPPAWVERRRETGNSTFGFELRGGTDFTVICNWLHAPW